MNQQQQNITAHRSITKREPITRSLMTEPDFFGQQTLFLTQIKKQVGRTQPETDNTYFKHKREPEICFLALFLYYTLIF